MTEPNSLNLPEGECAFCAYLGGARAYTVLERGALASILVTREQRGVGHVLVLPNAHRVSILDLDLAEGSAIMDCLVRAARAIDLTYERPGIAVWQNNGLPAHQTIPHVHFHAAGTLEGGDTERGPVTELTLAETEQIAADLRQTLGPPIPRVD